MSDPHAALYPMIVFYAMDAYPIFERIGVEAAKEASLAAQAFSLIEPLLMADSKGLFPDTDIPHFGHRSGPYCAALMAAFLIWRQHQSFEQPYIPSGSMLLQAAEEGYQNWKLLTGSVKR